MIYEEAKKVYFQHEARSGQVCEVNPTYGELLESGFVSVATSNLMSNPETLYGLTKVTKSKSEKPKVKEGEFELDGREALKSGIYVCGTTGSGKSDLMMYVTDWLMPFAKITVVDPSQDWMERSNIPNVVTVTNRGYAKLYNNHIIYDVSRLRRPVKKQFTEDLCQALMDYAVNQPKEERRHRFVIFEEAQLVFPEGSFRSDRYNACVELVSMGRNYNIRFGAITPFSANVDKMLTKITQQRYFGWTNERNDQRYLEGFIREKAEELKHLKAGKFIYHAPTRDVLRKIQIEPHRRTVSLRRVAPYPRSTETQGTEERVDQSLHSVAMVCAILGFVFVVASWMI